MWILTFIIKKIILPKNKAGHITAFHVGLDGFEREMFEV